MESNQRYYSRRAFEERVAAKRAMTDAARNWPMRDVVADWKKWSRTERLLAVLMTLILVALPLGLLLTGKAGV